MGCGCDFCKNYDKYRWATIMECPCNCHDQKIPNGHDGLCCDFPNGRKKENPYKKLKTADYYMKKINNI